MKHKNYSDFNLADFLADEDFRLWVLSPDENRLKFWNRWLSLHPEKKATVLKAREIVSSVRFPTAENLSEDDRNKTLDLILQGVPSNTKEETLIKTRAIRPLKTAYKLAVAASILIVLSTTIYLYFERGIDNQPIALAPTAQMMVKK
ncbi:MAG: hypothetical protein RJQ14_01000, partial [Marinoscillum sp.]